MTVTFYNGDCTIDSEVADLTEHEARSLVVTTLLEGGVKLADIRCGRNQIVADYIRTPFGIFETYPVKKCIIHLDDWQNMAEYN